MSDVIVSVESWDELLGTLLSEEGKNAVEWSIGAIISGGPKKILQITGPADSGKSSLFGILRAVIWYCREEDSLSVEYRSDGLYGITANSFMVSTDFEPLAKSPAHISYRLIQIQTTGTKIETSAFYKLGEDITCDPGPIGTQCLATYRRLGKTYFNQENNK